MMKYIVSQFRQPRGPLGALVGRIMAHSNAERAAWTVGLLNLEPDQKILEIGYGPGVGIQHAAKQAAFVAGVDISRTMLRQASRRNARAIRQGEVELHLSSAEAIPYPDGFFDGAFSINNIQFWLDRVASLAEVRRVLKPGGVLATTLQPRWSQTDEEVRAVANGIVEHVAAASFNIRSVKFLQTQPMLSFSVLAVK